MVCIQQMIFLSLGHPARNNPKKNFGLNFLKWFHKKNSPIFFCSRQFCFQNEFGINYRHDIKNSLLKGISFEKNLWLLHLSHILKEQLF